MNATRRQGSTGSTQERHGLYRCGAFRAARIRRPSIQYSRVVLPPGPNSWPLNIPFGCSVPSLAHHDQRWSAGVTHLLHTSA